MHDKNYIAIVLSLMICLLPAFVQAGVNLPFSSTLNCNDWDSSISFPATNCDGLEGNGTGISPNGNRSSISAASNYASGGGGKGFREWITDGQNIKSGGVQLKFNTPQSEVWIRVYLRYQAGFNWCFIGYHKLFYYNDGLIFEYAFSGGGLRLFDINNSANNYPYQINGFTWYDTNGSTGDGNFHSFEVHVKHGAGDGRYEAWVDGTRIFDYQNLTTSSVLIESVGIPVNQNNPCNASGVGVPYNGDAYIDIDDLAASNTGYIGLVNPTTYNLTISKTGTGTGTVTTTPSGMNCGATCVYAFNSGTGVTLNNVPDTDSHFDGWSGGDADCSDGSVTMSLAVACTAIFTANSPPPPATLPGRLKSGIHKGYSGGYE